MEPSISADGTTDPPDKGETQVFRLLGLPDELWSRIGNMVIDAEPEVNVQLRPKPKLPAVLRTYAEIRAELLKYWCAHKVRCISHGIWTYYEVMGVRDWLMTLPPQAIRSICGLHICIHKSHLGIYSNWFKMSLWDYKDIVCEFEEVQPNPLGWTRRVYYNIKFL